jgi:hypothetical protein
MSGSSRNKGVHFAPSPVPSSPASSSLADASIMSREDVSGALAFVNSQLLSHGFTYGNGISTDGLADIDATKLTKCLMGLLAQRTVRWLLCRYRLRRTDMITSVGGHETCGRSWIQVQNIVI